MIGKRIAAGRVYNFNNELTIRQLIFIIYLEVVKPKECQNSLGPFRTNRNTHTQPTKQSLYRYLFLSSRNQCCHLP